MDQAAHVETSPPAIKCLLIDLDGTLYPIANGYEQHVRYPSMVNPPMSCL